MIDPESGSGTSVPRAPIERSLRSLHGETVVDNYAWMRDRDDPRLLEFLLAERAYFDDRMRVIAPLVDGILTDLGERAGGQAHNFTWRIGDYEYVIEGQAGSRQPRYVRRLIGSDTVEVVLDLAELGRGRDFTRIGVFEPSPDGTLLAYSVDHIGYESYELRFRDLRDGSELPSARERTYYTGVWSADSRTFCYVVHDDAMRPHQVYAHDLDADPDTPDRLVWHEEDQHFTTTIRTTRNREWLVIANQSRTTTEELLVPTDRITAPPCAVLPREHGRVYFTEHQSAGQVDRVLVLVSKGREERRLLGTPAAELADRRFSEVLLPAPGTAWQRLDAFACGLLLSGYRDGTSVFQFFGTDGTTYEFGPETTAGCVIFEGRRDATRVQVDNRTDYHAELIEFTEHSLVDPPRHHRVRLATGDRESAVQDTVTGYDRSRYRTSKVFATAPDGTAVPVTIAHRDDVSPDGRNPCLVFAYGAYERPWEPVFSSSIATLLDRGFVYAIAHVRGGGELGRVGWVDGSMAAKPNSTADLLAARAHLVAQGWAAEDGVVCHASCAGSVITGQTYTQDPQLWAGVVAETPAIDLLNSMLDENIPLTVNEWEEWGDPRDADIYRLMRGYVAYENVSDRPRPPLLMTAAFNDPRVLVHKPAQWSAALREADTHGNLILLRTSFGDGGHHGPSSATEVALAAAQLLAFIVYAGTRNRARPVGERVP